VRGVHSTILKIKPDLDVNYFDYHLVFIGVPVYANLPPKPTVRFLEKQRSERGTVVAAAPELPGHFAVMFCTYGGGHTGLNEAIPALKYMGQFFEHVGIRVVDEWPVVGVFRQIKDPNYNTDGRIGNVMDRPSEQDLNDIRGKVTGLLHRLKYKLPINES
jgi:flavodoxin I